jgi:hypothetical protein
MVGLHALDCVIDDYVFELYPGMRGEGLRGDTYNKGGRYSLRD